MFGEKNVICSNHLCPHYCISVCLKQQTLHMFTMQFLTSQTLCLGACCFAALIEEIHLECKPQ